MFAKIIDGTQKSTDHPVEQNINYWRTDGLKMEMTVTYVDDGACIGGVSLWTACDLHTAEPPLSIDLNREELRYLRTLLNRPETVAMLEEPLASDDLEPAIPPTAQALPIAARP